MKAYTAAEIFFSIKDSDDDHDKFIEGERERDFSFVFN